MKEPTLQDVLDAVNGLRGEMAELLGKASGPAEAVPGVPSNGPLTLEQAKLLASSSPQIVLLGMEFPKGKSRGAWKFGSNALGPFGMSIFHRDVA